MDLLILIVAISALSASLLAVTCAIMVCMIRNSPEPVPYRVETCVVVEPAQVQVTCDPETESVTDSHAGSFTLPLPPAFGMNTAQLC